MEKVSSATATATGLPVPLSGNPPQLRNIFERLTRGVIRPNDPQDQQEKAFTQEITRARRYHDEKSVWEYLNNVVEDIHLFTWRKTAVASCTGNYQQKRYGLEKEFRELDAEHRKERITLRYDRPTKSEEHGQEG